MTEDFEANVITPKYYAQVYDTLFLADSLDDVEALIEEFERTEWKDKRLRSWTIQEWH